MATHTEFKAAIYVLTAAEGGRTSPFFDGYNGARFSFADNNITGRIRLPKDH